MTPLKEITGKEYQRIYHLGYNAGKRRFMKKKRAYENALYDLSQPEEQSKGFLSTLRSLLQSL